MSRQVRITDAVADELDRRVARGGSLSQAANDLLEWALAEVVIPGEPAAAPVANPVDGYQRAPAGKARTSTRSALAAGFGNLSRVRSR